LRKFLKVKNFLSFLNFNNVCIKQCSFLSFLRFFDEFYLMFFNFFVYFENLDKFEIDIIYNGKNFNFCFGYFLPFLKFFNMMEIFIKNCFFNFFGFDFFFFRDKFLRNLKYVMPYDYFIFRINVVWFLFFFKDCENIRMAKYNEYILNSFLFFVCVILRFFFFKRYFNIRNSLLITHMHYYKYAIFTVRFLLFESNIKRKMVNIKFCKNNIELYKRNFVLHFLMNIMCTKFINR